MKPDKNPREDRADHGPEEWEQPPRQADWRVAARFLPFFILLTVLFHCGNRESMGFSAECLHPIGGGLIPAGGDFPHYNNSVCIAQLKAYFHSPGGQYYRDVQIVADSALAYFKELALKRAPSADQIIVFDIDETVLSNARTFFQPQDVRKPGSTALGRAGNMDGPGPVQPTVPLQLKATDSSDSPPIMPMLEVYKYLYAANYSVVFITGRKEHSRAPTTQNLEFAGYGKQCSGQVRTPEPCYVHLYLREETDGRLASVYKPEKRRDLEQKGYQLVGNFGDQFSDLEGTDSAVASFKLPNPVYYIL